MRSCRVQELARSSACENVGQKKATSRTTYRTSWYRDHFPGNLPGVGTEEVAWWYSLCVPDWKHVVVGDAFQLSSHDFNYYRDLFLLWPFLLFTIAGLVNLSGVEHDHRIGMKFLALSLVTILLARERFILIGGALGFCAVQSSISFVLKHDWIALAISISSSTLFLLLLRGLRNYKPSYSWPKRIRIADILTRLTSLGLTLAVFSWIRR
jgi:hypothetical protein